MSTILSNIYPPIVPDIMPAFNIDGECKICFNLSSYNSITEISNFVQVSITNQNTNLSILDKNLYPTGILLAQYQQETQKTGYNYYVTVSKTSLQQSQFNINQFYKVQLRFIKNNINLPENNIINDKWLSSYKDYFSEWSKVCLIQGVTQPTVTIVGFNDIQNEDERITLTNPTLSIVGNISYGQVGEEDYLKSYNIKLYNLNDLFTPVFQSEEIFSNYDNLNQFNYVGDYELIDGEQYKLIFTYTTNKLYTKSKEYNFVIIQNGSLETLDAEILAIPENDLGRIKIKITSIKPFIGNLAIRRTSSKSNFHSWEDVCITTYGSEQQINYTWYDKTVESGIWYKYCVQKINSSGFRSAIVQTDQPVMCYFDDIFLTTGKKQLKIMFNPSLNEFKYNVTQAQQITIGSKYPFITRNGANYFRSFPIGGLISSFSDTTDWYDPHFQDGEFKTNKNETGLFTTKAEIYGNNKSLYDNFNLINNISQYNDYIYEKEFRQKVYDFLYKNDVKLFRSTTEGNILIKLMNIDFQPVESLGRRLYSFTANAVEIDEANIKNYDKYNIQTIGAYSEYISYEYEKMGQIVNSFKNGEDIIQNLTPKYNKNTESIGFVNEVIGITKLKIEISSPPYVILQNGDKLTPAAATAAQIPKNAKVGYILTINNKDFIITPTLQRRLDTNGKIEDVTVGFFELKDGNILIKNLSFKTPYPLSTFVDYTAKLVEKEDTSNIILRTYTTKKIGQLFGVFNPQSMLIQKIYNKYRIKNDNYYQRLINIEGIEIDSLPGAIVYIKDSKDSDFNRHILENGYLQLMDSEASILGLYFQGIHLYTGYIETGESYNTFSQVKNPIHNGIYTIKKLIIQNIIDYNKITDLLTINESEVIEKTNHDFSLILQQQYENTNNRYIYYNNNWYPITQNYDIICPIDGLVNYYCTIQKGVYNS